MTSRINVLLLITELNVGGAERIVEQLATRLSRDRYNVKVACLYDPDAIGANIRAAGIPVVNLNMCGKWDLRAPYRLFRLLRMENIQILHSHLFHANFLASVIGRIARTPCVIVTRHNIDIGGAHREWINRCIKGLRDVVVVISQEVQVVESQRSRIDLSNTELIPNGVQVESFTKANQSDVENLAQEWGIKINMPIIGTLARFHKQKGYTYLLNAAVMLKKSVPDINFFLVGDGALKSLMVEKALSLGLSDNMIFTGIRRDVPEILALLDVFVLPSLWEGLPIALLEAMAAGLPVVATRVGGVPEVVVDGVTGFLVPPRDPEALADAILRLLHDPDLRQRMGKAGRARVAKHFSVEQMVHKTESLYEQLLKEIA